MRQALPDSSNHASLRIALRPRDVAFERSVPILAENRCVPDRIIRVQSDKPAKQQAVTRLFHEESLATDRVQRLKQKIAQQSFRCNRRTAGLGMQTFKKRQKIFRNHIDYGAIALSGHCDGISSFVQGSFSRYPDHAATRRFAKQSSLDATTAGQEELLAEVAGSG
jgi:hypothetical protein